MPKSMEGPFAEKLKAATAGRTFPESSREPVIISDGLDLSGGGKSGREKRRAKHEQHERGERGGEGVSGRSVHTRGQFVESVAAESSIEGAEQQELSRLFADISAQYETLSQLNAFMDAKGYTDAEGDLMETAAARLEEANRIMRPFLRESGLVPAAADRESLQKIQEQSAQDIADLKEALEGLESAGELVVPADLKALFEAPSNQSAEAAVRPTPRAEEPVARGEEEPNPEKRSYASYSEEELRVNWNRSSQLEMLETVEGQLKGWEDFDKQIAAFKSQERVVDDLRRSAMENKFESALSLIGRSEEIADTLKGIRERFEQNGRLDKRDAGKLTALFFDYHRLLVAAEGVLQERDRETPIVEATKAARAKETEAKREVAEVTTSTPVRETEAKPSISEKVARLKELLEQWEALEQEFGDRALRLAIRELRKLDKKVALPPTGKIAKWFAEHDGPKAWQGKTAAADRALLTDDALPSMEGMVRDGKLVAEKLRKEQLTAETTALAAPAETERQDNKPIVRGDIWDAPGKDAIHVGRKVVVTGVTSDGKIEYRFFDVNDIGNAENMGFGSALTEADMREWLSAEGFSYNGRQEDVVDPPVASVLTLDRRPVIDGKLTEWERMNPVEQNRLRRELFSRKDRFVSGLNERLKRAGVSDGDRRNTIIKYLDEYLPQAIELVVKVPLQDTDREALLRDLKKEIAIA